jgi:AcrR family transcriptional regulator
MGVPRKQATIDPDGRGARARTMRLMLETAISLMQAGENPSVSDVAEAAGVSRATSYRYFPSQSALVGAVVDTALGPILDWSPPPGDASRRLAALMETSLPRIGAFEATFRAALQLSLQHWAQSKAGKLGAEAPFRRGHRVDLLEAAVAPLADVIDARAFDRLVKGLSLVFGIEAFVVLKDIWKLEQGEVEETIRWVAQALVSAAVQEGNLPPGG